MLGGGPGMVEFRSARRLMVHNWVSLQCDGQALVKR